MDFVDYGWLDRNAELQPLNGDQNTIFLVTKSEFEQFRDISRRDMEAARERLSETFSESCLVAELPAAGESLPQEAREYTALVYESSLLDPNHRPVVKASRRRTVLLVPSENVTDYLSRCLTGLLEKPMRAAACVVASNNILDKLDVYDWYHDSSAIFHRLGIWAAYDDCSSHRTSDLLGFTSCVRMAYLMAITIGQKRLKLTEAGNVKNKYVNTAALKMVWLKREDKYADLPSNILLERATNVLHRCITKTYIEEDENVIQNIYTEFRKVLELVTRLAKIEYHPEGAKSVRNVIYRVLAWSYVVLTVVLALIVAVKNLASRDNVFERITDMVAVLTTLLVSVFGLMKLTSEDPNAIRNSLRGFKVLRYFEDVLRELRCNDVDELRRLLTVGAVDADWLDREGSCYADLSRSGNIRDSGCCSLGQLVSAGWFFSQQYALNIVSNKLVRFEVSGNRGHIEWIPGEGASWLQVFDANLTIKG